MGARSRLLAPDPSRSPLPPSGTRAVQNRMPLGLGTVRLLVGVWYGCVGVCVWYVGGVRLSVRARYVGVHYRTAYGWWRKGQMPVPAYQTPSGSIMVDVPTPSESGGRCVVYARVSSRGRRSGRPGGACGCVGDTERLQRRRGRDRGRVCAQQPPTETQAAAGRRGGSAIVVEHRDRYCRFGAECIEVALSAQGRKVVAVDDAETDNGVLEILLPVHLAHLSNTPAPRRSWRLAAPVGFEHLREQWEERVRSRRAVRYELDYRFPVRNIGGGAFLIGWSEIPTGFVPRHAHLPTVRPGACREAVAGSPGEALCGGNLSDVTDAGPQPLGCLLV